MLSNEALDHYDFSDSDLLKIFYSEIFPCKELTEWLTYGDDNKSLKNREFSFTFTNGSYLRFQSFEDPDQLQAFLIKNTPVKIDLGAIYSAKPNERKLYNSKSFKPLERELIFDLDMTDYDNVRTCCSGKNVCAKCWKFLACAMKIIDKSLEDDFGYEKRLWVFSGRRGIHCWVADEKARRLNPSSRKAIVSYFEEQNKNLSDSLNYTKGNRVNHPFFKRSLEIMRHFFESYVLVQQDIISSKEAASKFLSLPGISDLKNELESDFYSETTGSSHKWLRLSEVLEKRNPKYKSDILNQVIMYYMLPRIDSHVSIQLNHLLKLPFCIHPDSGKICVPVNAENIENFDPSHVPNLLELILNLRETGKASIPGMDIFEKTCL